MSALMTEKGYTSYPAILDGKYGFWCMLGTESCDFNLMVDKLGEKWWFMGTIFKPWPCCRYIHHPMTAEEVINASLLCEVPCHLYGGCWLKEFRSS